MKLLVLIAAGAAALAIPSAVVSTASADLTAMPTPTASVVVATSPAFQASSTFVSPPGATASTLCFGDGPLCPSVWAPTIQFGPITNASAGTTVWTDTSAAVFASALSAMTDGINGRVYWNLQIPLPSGGWLWHGLGYYESLFFDTAGPNNGIDLAGYTIDGVGLRIDSATFGESGYSVAGQFLFTGIPPSFGVCMQGGWQTLYGPHGVAFRNEGDCIQLAITGK